MRDGTTVFLRKRKLTFDSPSAPHGRPFEDPSSHAVQQQDAKKNYIGIVTDTTEGERMADTAAQSQPHVMSYLVNRLRAALKRHPKVTRA